MHTIWYYIHDMNASRRQTSARIIVPSRPVSYLQRSFAMPQRQLRAEKRRLIVGKRTPVLSFPVLSAPASVAMLPATAQPTIKQLALLLPAHNEELIIEATIRSAIAAGQAIEDIYVVNDNSSDDTQVIATRLLGTNNVLNVERSGKALAVKKAITKFELESRYTWLHIADADSIFSQDYFRHYCNKLDPEKYAVAVGFVQSLRGNWISTYRALTYTYSQQVTRRIQSRMGMISVFPGPITCFRTDIISRLEFGGASLTEDFDITLQVHRKKLGKIVFIPQAVNYTQDPQTLTDFCKQNMRWQRGFFQGVKKYKIGLRGQRIDASLGFQMFQTLLFLLQLFVLLPFILITTHNWIVIPVIIAADIIVNGAIALFSSVAAKRWSLIGALPYFYFLRWIEIGIYITAFVEVIILGRFKENVIGWSTSGRRYELSKQALLDAAK
jgi:cellulose synthase/poly-beta-1,6-N-acetylglucosamine synthase-like glycosyltransferase